MKRRDAASKVRPHDGSKMKILIINYEFPPLGGGGGVASNDLALEWAKTAQVDVLTSWYRGLPYYEEVHGIRVYRAKIFFRKSRDAATFISMLSYLPFGFFKGLRLCRENRYDVINTHFAVPSGPLGYVLGKIFRIPNVLSLHGGDIYDPSKKMSPHKSPFFSRVVRFILNCADRIVAQSSNTRDNTIRYYAPKKEIEIIPLAFHPPVLPRITRKKLGIADTDFILVTIGRLIKRKAIDVMIEALLEADDANIKLMIMGDGPEREYLESLVKRMKLQKRVTFLGFVSDQDKYNYLSTADLFISTSLHEGFGIVFMEAMHCGLPIVCSDVGGQVDFLRDEENALLVPVGDARRCAESVQRFYTDKKLYSKCSGNNIKKVKDFLAAPVARNYVEIFNEVTGLHGEGSGKELRAFIKQP